MVRKKILLVDDSNTVLMMEKMMLSGLPYDTLVARTGKQAVEMAIAQKPDLILMDIVMPDIDGLEACRQLRAREETKAIPIIIVTTRGEPAKVRAGFESGATEYITKPFDTGELLAKLRTHLGDPRAAAK
jgi:DNA-binding response OmpR family regulator